MVSLTTFFLFLLPFFTNKIQNVSCESSTDVSPVLNEPELITYTSPDKRLKMIYHPNDLAVRESCECSKCIDSMDAWSVLHSKMLESYHASYDTLKTMYNTTLAASFQVFQRVCAAQHAMFQNVSEVIRRSANGSAGAVKSFGVYAYDKSMTATSHVRNATTSLKEWFLARFSADLLDESNESKEDRE